MGNVRKYEFRSIDAWMYDDGWTWNDSCTIDVVTLQLGEENKFLKEKAYYPRRYEVIEDGNGLFELQERKTHRPVLALIPMD